MQTATEQIGKDTGEGIVFSSYFPMDYRACDHMAPRTLVFYPQLDHLYRPVFFYPLMMCEGCGVLTQLKVEKEVTFDA